MQGKLDFICNYCELIKKKLTKYRTREEIFLEMHLVFYYQPSRI